MYSSHTAALLKPPWTKKSGASLVGVEGTADSSSRGPEAVSMNVRVILLGDGRVLVWELTKSSKRPSSNE